MDELLTFDEFLAEARKTISNAKKNPDLMHGINWMEGYLASVYGTTRLDDPDQSGPIVEALIVPHRVKE